MSPVLFHPFPPRVRSPEIVSRYLEYISSKDPSAEEIDAEVLQLSDRIPLKDLPDLKDSKYQYLKKKYVHD